MNIAGTDYLINDKALCIFLTGCNRNPKCEGCHNKELWDFEQGVYWKSALAVLYMPDMVDKIWVMGGEPLDQDPLELNEFLSTLKLFNKELWLWTGYRHVPDKVCQIVDAIKVGAHDCSLPSHVVEGVKLSSSNQQIYKT